MIFGISALGLGVALWLLGLRRCLKERKEGMMACIHDSECANHAGGCGCEPCRTLRAIVAPVLLRETESARGHVAHLLRADTDNHPEGTCDVCK